MISTWIELNLQLKNKAGRMKKSIFVVGIIATLALFTACDSKPETGDESCRTYKSYDQAQAFIKDSGLARPERKPYTFDMPKSTLDSLQKMYDDIKEMDACKFMDAYKLSGEDLVIVMTSFNMRAQDELIIERSLINLNGDPQKANEILERKNEKMRENLEKSIIHLDKTEPKE